MSDAPTPDPTPPAAPDAGPRFCLRCGERLTTHPLDDVAPTKCPRCGLPFSPDRPETYADAPAWRRPRWTRLAGFFLMAVALGVVGYALIRNDVMGVAVFFVVPFAIGGLLGYTTRASVWLSLLLSLAAVACVVFVLVAADLSGIFCGLTLSAVFLGPTLVGAVVGWGLQVATRNRATRRRHYAILTMIVGLPFGADRVESRWPLARETAEVSTSATFQCPADRAWESVVFYEQVRHEPPFLLTLALPRPVRSERRRAAVGESQRCVYERGYLVKTITASDEPRLLAFDVSEQHLHFEHDVELLDGSFIVQPLGDGRTRVVLTTRYRRLLRPAWLWAPMERTIIETLHGHVLEGMRRHAVQR